jgi:uracil-DNA glycosylase family 4
MNPSPLEIHAAALIECERCPRLVAWRRRVASEKRAAFRGEEYWGKPVPGFGDPEARLVLVGLAPAAHGANRTGRMFTGDRSGDWLYRALHRAGFASQARAESRFDGLTLDDAWVTSAVRCAPPANKPTAEERDACARWLSAELALLSNARVLLCLGALGYHAVWRNLGATGVPVPRPRPRFAHGLEVGVGDETTVMCSFHPSQQNTFTGRLTEEMFDDVMARAGALIRG